MDQSELISIFCARPHNFAWFLGAGASRSAGLPTATGILWDLKRQYYCREENQEISKQDVQNDAVRQRIQSFMESRGFPAEWSNDEYAIYFEKLFGDKKEDQRRYLVKVLSEDRVRLTVGCRALGAFMAGGFSRVHLNQEVAAAGHERGAGYGAPRKDIFSSYRRRFRHQSKWGPSSQS